MGIGVRVRVRVGVRVGVRGRVRVCTPHFASYSLRRPRYSANILSLSSNTWPYLARGRVRVGG